MINDFKPIFYLLKNNHRYTNFEMHHNVKTRGLFVLMGPKNQRTVFIVGGMFCREAETGRGGYGNCQPESAKINAGRPQTGTSGKHTK